MQSEYHISHDVRQAALGTTHKNLSWSLDVAKILEAEKEETSFKEIVESITRVMNMTKNESNVKTVKHDLLASASEKKNLLPKSKTRNNIPR